MRISDIIGRRAVLILTLLLTGGLIAACGSSSSSSGSSTNASASASAGAGAGGPGSARGAALRTCLKAHGVTLPARRAGGYGGPGGPGGAGTPGGAPGAAGAPSGTGTTGGPPPGGGFFGAGAGAGRGRFRSNPKLRAALQACGASFRGGRRVQLSHAAVTEYVTCVRQHGYNLPQPNFSGKGSVFPASIRTNKKFQAASRSCQSLLFPRRTGAPPTTTGRSS